MRIIPPVIFPDAMGSFARASSGSYVGKLGTVVSATTNEPRLQYDPVTLLPLGLLSESAATNLLLQSQVFGTTWATSGTVTSNTAADPAGTTTGDTFAATGAGHALAQTTAAFSAASSITVSVWAKKLASNWLRISLAGAAVDAWFDLNTGVVGSHTAGSGNHVYMSMEIAEYPSGWYRCSLRIQTAVVTTLAVGLSFVAANSATSANGNSGYLWGAQAEVGAVTSYITTTTVTVTRAADIVTATAPVVIYSDVPETDGTGEWSAATTYAIGDVAILAATHTKYQSRTAGNINHAPASDTTNWEDIGPTNRWAMIDLETNSQTSQTTKIRVLLKPGSIDSLALTGLEGDTLDIAMVVSGETVYSSQKSLDATIITDWYEYWFSAFDFLSQSVDLNVPNYSGGIISIEITSSSSAKCGAVAIGQSFDVGEIQYGVTARRRDYSTVTRDAFGSATLVKRKNVRTVSGDVWIEKVRSRAVNRLLGELAATPAMFVGIEDDDDEYYELVTLLGLLIDSGIGIEYTDGVVMPFEIEEL